jgi:hypothetical protein
MLFNARAAIARYQSLQAAGTMAPPPSQRRRSATPAGLPPWR